MADEKVRMTELPPATEIRDEAIILINQGGVDYKAPAPMILRAENNLNEVDPSQGRASLNVYSREETDERSKLAAKATPVATIAEGLSKTSNGDLFVVPQGSGAESSFIYYRNTGGSATEVARDAGAGAIESVKDKIPTNYEKALLFMADNGVIAAILEDGTFRVIQLDADSVSTRQFIADALAANKLSIVNDSIESSGYPFAIKASNGYVLIMDDNGVLHSVGIDAQQLMINGVDITTMFASAKPAPKYPLANPVGIITGYEHIPHYGQSQVIGTTNGVIHNAEFDPKTFMLTGGLRAFNVAGHNPNVNEADYYTGLVPIRDRFGETFIPGQAIFQRKNLDANYPLLTVNPVYTLGGQGGSTVAMLKKGTEAYTALIAQWTGAVNSIKALGEKYRNHVMIWAQGGSDDAAGTTPDSWAQQTEQLRTDINADVKAATGVDIDPAYIIIQINNYMRYPVLNGKPNIGLKQLELAEAAQQYFGACPTYIMDFIDVAHWTKESQIKVGAYIEKVHNNILTTGGTWKPVSPKKITTADLFSLVKFNLPQGGTLEFDTTIVNPVDNYGFTAEQADGTAIPIDRVRIVSPDTVEIRFTVKPLAGAIIRYAQSGQVGDPNATDGSGLGRQNGVRGNLRDNAGERDTITISDAQYPLHNWCWMFTKSLGVK